MQLRPYQQAAVNAVYDYLRDKNNRGKNPCVEICTGGGKTIVFSQIVKDAVELWDGRVLVLTHVKELIEQGAEKLRLFCPNIKIGVYSAGLNRRDTDTQVLVAGIQSVYRKAGELGHFDLVIIDECHLLPPDGDGMYRTLLADLKHITPHLRVIGFTATPYRTESGPICTPDGILNDICYATSIRLLIQDGYLSPIRSKSSKFAVDTDALGVRAGEFIAAEVEAKVNAKDVVERACREIVALTKDRKAVILFCASVAHCHRVAETIEALSGEACGVVTGDTPADERAELLRRIRGHQSAPNLLGETKPPLRFLANVNVCTTGFDAPNIDCVAILRPTASPGLYVQMAGRGLRLSPGKKDCLVLDYGENILRHGPLDDVRSDGANRKKRKDVRACPVCNEVLTPSATECPECGYVFPAPKPKESNPNIHRGTSSSADILGNGKKRAEERRLTLTVLDTEYATHRSHKNPAAPLSLKVTFITQEPPYRVSIWKFPECDPDRYWARAQFRQWWERMLAPGAIEAPPKTAKAALYAITVGGQLKRPATVTLAYPKGDERAIPRDIAYTFQPEPTQAEVNAELARQDAMELPF